MDAQSLEDGEHFKFSGADAWDLPSLETSDATAGESHDVTALKQPAADRFS
jgi:hypothetical protein